MRLRAGRDADAEAFIRLVRDAWAEYPGCVFDLDGELPELRALATHFAEQGGALWAAEDGAGEVVGMAAARPLHADRAWEVCRVYLGAAARGTGLAQRLLDAAEAHAVARGAERLVLWTDTRFAAAHRFYEKRGYVRQGAIRILDDLSKSLEFRYGKPARGLVVEALDAAAASSAERRLADILAACVAAGDASVEWLAPMPVEAAREYWRSATQQLAGGKRAILAAWLDGALAGSVTLDLAFPQNQPRRAQVEKLLVDPAFRRRGVGRALLARAEQAAARLGRRSLTLDTREGVPGEALYRAAGWREAGRIPASELDESGAAHDILVFWKEAR